MPWRLRSITLFGGIALAKEELLELDGVVDEVLPEPIGGAHRDTQTTADRIKAG